MTYGNVSVVGSKGDFACLSPFTLLIILISLSSKNGNTNFSHCSFALFNRRSDSGNIHLSSSQEVQTSLDIRGNIYELPSNFEGHSESRKAVGMITRAVKACVSDQGRGKINLTGARDQSLHQFFGDSTKGSMHVPSLSVSSEQGSIKMQTLSWADNIIKMFKQ